jgi:hypothetical protein
MADNTARISAAISGIALIISVASYRDSRKANERADEARQPAIQISSVRLIAKPVFGQKLQLELDLHNFGQSVGRDVEITYQYYVDTRGMRAATQNSISGALFGIGNVAPGSSKLVTLADGNILGRPEHSSRADTLLVYGSLVHRVQQDLGSLVEPWCFVTDFARATTSPTTTLYSCDSQFDSDLRNIPGGATLAPDSRAVPGGLVGGQR